MWKWLRSWFAWRFSLGRLVVAVVFLGTFMWLNICGPQMQVELPPEFDSQGKSLFWEREVVTIWGWPLPIASEKHEWNPATDAHNEPLSEKEAQKRRWMPWTHQTYLMMELRCLHWGTVYWTRPPSHFGLFVIPAILDALFALTVVALILFLQIPRCKAPGQVK